MEESRPIKYRSLSRRFSIFTGVLLLWVVAVTLSWDVHEHTFDWKKGAVLCLIVAAIAAMIARFTIQLLASSPPLVAARLAFRCSPKGKFLGLSVNGRMLSFAENVFYEFRLSKIASVWSVIDKAAIEAQLPG